MSTLEIWENYRLQLFNYIKRQVSDPHVAKDILQDVFIKAEIHKHEIRDPKRLGSWMFSITRNSITDHFRKGLKEKKLIENLDHTPVVPDHAYNACVARCLNQLIHTLPPPYRDALLKADVEGLQQTALADALGISYSGAKSRVQRARKMLREKLMELYTIETDTYGNVIVCEDKVPCACAPGVFEC
jgi:RNA polymerase sigma-70 factor, ECF subfamily